MKTLWKLMLLFSGFFLFPLNAQNPVHYSISFANASHHEAQVTVKFSEIKNQPLDLHMSRSSPGRYALHEFAKNVYKVQAYDASGNELSVTRPNEHQWQVHGNSRDVTIQYTIFGDRCDGTYLAIDNRHAHMNMPATFMWAKGFEEHPVEIHFDVQDRDWRVATQLQVTDDPYLFKAPDLDYFMDSPTELSNFELREWQVQSNGRPYTIRIAMHHQGNDEQLDAFDKVCREIVKTQLNVFGELPDYEYGSYTFIVDLIPDINRDGMEHRNSTILTLDGSLEKDLLKLAGSTSHEFFHAWNIERIRPRSLQPFDFSRANMSAELWFGEGFTDYYGDLQLVRAGVLNIDKYAEELTRMLNYVLNSPGRFINSAVQMSQYAPFVDAGRSNDPKNLTNTFISYYSIGAAIALGLDLTMREKYPGLGLDDFMKAVWQKYGKTETPYTNQDLQQILAEVTGDATFADDYFKRYIYGHEMPDFAELLVSGGFILQKEKTDSAWIGEGIDFTDGKMTVGWAAQQGSPLYQAGLDRGDIINRLDDDSLSTEQDWKRWLGSHKPGEEVSVSFTKRNEKKSANLVLMSDPNLEVIPFEHQSLEIEEGVQNFRRQWLGIGPENMPDSLQRYCPQCSRSYPFYYEFCPIDGSALDISPR